MYKIKQVNEDFRVFEKFGLPLAETGHYQYFTLEKNGLSTSEAIFLLSEKLRIPRKMFGFAGNKDKRAVTRQAISIETSRDIGSMESAKLKATYLGKGDERISLGSHSGNEFWITIRNLGGDEVPEEISFIPNYFDSQRFSSSNVDIGAAILAKDFEKAVTMIMESMEGTETYSRMAKRLEKNQHDYVNCLREFDTKSLKL